VPGDGGAADWRDCLAKILWPWHPRFRSRRSTPPALGRIAGRRDRRARREAAGARHRHLHPAGTVAARGRHRRRGIRRLLGDRPRMGRVADGRDRARGGHEHRRRHPDLDRADRPADLVRDHRRAAGLESCRHWCESFRWRGPFRWRRAFRWRGPFRPAIPVARSLSRLARHPRRHPLHPRAFAHRRRASERLLRVFRAWFGWIPGGTAVVCAVLCSFFTVFTGGSGVTILALGGVLFPALIKDGYRERFSLGLLTASGSLGLLLPPALPLILYAVVAQIPIEDIFIGGILPGILLTAMVAAWGMREGIVSGAGRQPFDGAEAVAAMWAAKWELAMPAL